MTDQADSQSLALARRIMDMAEADRGLSLNTLAEEIYRWTRQDADPPNAREIVMKAAQESLRLAEAERRRVLVEFEAFRAAPNTRRFFLDPVVVPPATSTYVSTGQDVTDWRPQPDIGCWADDPPERRREAIEKMKRDRGF